MNTATITPTYVNQPKPGKKLGSIKDAAGNFYLCPPVLLAGFRVGVPTSFEFKSAPKQDGSGDWLTVTSVAGMAEQPVRQQRGNAKTPEDQENIFVCGVVNHAIAYQGYKLDVRSLTLLVQDARTAWREGSKDSPVQMAASAARVPQADPDDDIPF